MSQLGELVQHFPHESPADQVLLLGLIRERRSELQEEAKRLGEKLFREKPQDFARRIEAYWKTWRGRH